MKKLLTTKRPHAKEFDGVPHVEPDDANESSPLVRAMRTALSEMSSKKGLVLRVSVANEPQWERSGADRVFVRWLCWSIEDDVEELTEPDFAVVSPDVTGGQLAAELPSEFPEIEVVVDDDIHV